MGEFIFSFSYGGALIVMGFVTRFFIKRMDAERKGVESVEMTVSNENLTKVV
ncbi:hypothetical protein [Sporosarcina sp. JAI121]|uniref:hypothetical protein n=1 Tax=Sporosarcina sp. JAI121 TaxID=2723064 RepID=UPI0015CB4B5B|nr:hypothetical protein [Sporosarcina sp. JAI121]NYF24375.1 hypothetical protein [Sporosarcina sp. JAI121]